MSENNISTQVSLISFSFSLVDLQTQQNKEKKMFDLKMFGVCFVSSISNLLYHVFSSLILLSGVEFNSNLS